MLQTCRPFCTPRSRTFSAIHAQPQGPIVHIPHSSIYPLGVNNKSGPLFRNVSWTIQPEEAWAVFSTNSSGAKTSLLQALTGHLRISPPPPPPYGLFPFLEGRDSHKYVSLVSFAHRSQNVGGAFYDFTARYGAVREEDKMTLRETFFPETAKPLHDLAIPAMYTHPDDVAKLHSDHAKERVRRELFEELTIKLDLKRFLDLPMIALSNGQTRKARIVKALLEQPELLILDEPLTGLDVTTRELLISLLCTLHVRNSPHVILGMRPQDPIPAWTTHLALIRPDGTIHTGEKQKVLDAAAHIKVHQSSLPQNPEPSAHRREMGDVVVNLAGVSVSYGDRKVLKDIHWTIKENSRWHLIGVNGAGKTTLLAMLTGEHPQSYTQSSKLTLFSRPRSKWATPHLHARIGRVSPEMHNAFPRRKGMTVWDAVGTGFEGNFVPRGRLHVGYGADGAELEQGADEERWRVRRMWDVVRGLGPTTWRGELMRETETEARRFSDCAFADLSPGEQSMVLLMRALVGRPPLVLLDEAWAGMDEGMVKAARTYLRDGGLEDGQACIVVSHWEEEVPWNREDGVQRFRLVQGLGRIE